MKKRKRTYQSSLDRTGCISSLAERLTKDPLLGLGSFLVCQGWMKKRTRKPSPQENGNTTGYLLLTGSGLSRHRRIVLRISDQVHSIICVPKNLRCHVIRRRMISRVGGFHLRKCPLARAMESLDTYDPPTPPASL